jgi:hypothetical protein
MVGVIVISSPLERLAIPALASRLGGGSGIVPRDRPPAPSCTAAVGPTGSRARSVQLTARVRVGEGAYAGYAYSVGAQLIARVIRGQAAWGAAISTDFMLRHDRHGALADERDGHRVGAHAVARDAAGGVGGVEGQ